MSCSLLLTREMAAPSLQLLHACAQSLFCNTRCRAPLLYGRRGMCCSRVSSLSPCSASFGQYGLHLRAAHAMQLATNATCTCCSLLPTHHFATARCRAPFLYGRCGACAARASHLHLRFALPSASKGCTRVLRTRCSLLPTLHACGLCCPRAVAYCLHILAVGVYSHVLGF